MDHAAIKTHAVYKNVPRINTVKLLPDEREVEPDMPTVGLGHCCKSTYCMSAFS